MASFSRPRHESWAERGRAVGLDGLSSTILAVNGGGCSDGSRICLAMQGTQVRSLGREDPLEKEMATYSSILAWRIPMD